MADRPLGDRVVLLPAPPETRTPGGIYIPRVSEEQPTEGEVLAVGPGARHPYTGVTEPLTVHVGQTVLFSKFVGSKIIFEGREALLVRESDILLVRGESGTNG